MLRRSHFAKCLRRQYLEQFIIRPHRSMASDKTGDRVDGRLTDLSDMRMPYVSAEEVGLDIGSLARCPYEQFDRWLKDAVALGRDKIPEPNAMSVATVAANGQPSSRMVLLKFVTPPPAGDWRGEFIFVTNYESRKGAELGTASCSTAFGHPARAALLFYWPFFNRQVRIEGIVSKTPESVSDDYWRNRPVESQLSGAVSKQSRPISVDRGDIDKAVEEKRAELAGGKVPRPSDWGGVSVAPETFEFWQGRTDRCHDRLVFAPRQTLKENEPFEDAENGWTIQRLAP